MVEPKKIVTRWYTGVGKQPPCEKNSNLAFGDPHLSWNQQLCQLEDLRRRGNTQALYQKVNKMTNIRDQPNQIRAIEAGDELIIEPQQVQRIL